MLKQERLGSLDDYEGQGEEVFLLGGRRERKRKREEEKGLFPFLTRGFPFSFFKQPSHTPFFLSLFLSPKISRHIYIVRPLPQGATKLLGLDLEAETGVEIEIITIIFVASSLPSVCGERQGRPPAAPPPALRPRAPLHGRRTADAQHVRQGKAQQRLLPGALVVSLMGVVECFLSVFEFF